jgi:anti-sigma regulatory factor (Ser/Thr protein kinase)
VRAVAATVEAVDVATLAARAVGSDDLAPRAARRFVDEVLADAGFDDVLDTVELLVTEVVTNAVMHARSEARVVIRLLDDAVRVEVTDTDDSFPARRVPRDDQPGGRGLDLVEKMSRSWGIDMLTVGKRTWFEVAREEDR